MTERSLQPVPEDWQRALAIAAHPDDLEYGTSCAVAKWTAAGKEIIYLLVSRGEAGIDAMPPERVGPLREAEEREAARLVGVEAVEFLGHADGIIEYGLPLRRDLARAIRRHRPDVVITGNFELSWPGGGLNQADHRAVGLAACDAAADARNRWAFSELLAEGLAAWGGTRWAFVNEPLNPTHACEIEETALEQGIASLRAHRAYFENLGRDFDPDTFLRGRASEVGQLMGCPYAIAFGILRI